MAQNLGLKWLKRGLTNEPNNIPAANDSAGYVSNNCVRICFTAGFVPDDREVNQHVK